MTDARPQTPWLDLWSMHVQCERVAELLGAGEIPWDGPPPTQDYFDAVAAQNAAVERWAEAERIALEWWQEREWEREEEAARLHAGGAVDAFMTGELPARAGRRARACHVFALLSKVPCKTFLRHGALVVDPPPPDELAPAVRDLEPELCDLIGEDREQA